jgi:SAM-dependent methyltransferase
MKDEDVLRYFDRRLDAHGVAVQAVDWGSEGSQRMRFEVLAGIGPLGGARVLDAGCGLGDLWAFLRSVSPSVDYEGWDVNPRMIAAATERFPDARFRAVDAGSGVDLDQQFDWVVASGLFYLRDEAFFSTTVRRLFARCRRGLAFNTLSAWADRRTPGEFYAEPDRVLDVCRTLSRRLTLRHDYLPHDFTVYVYRDA